MINFRINVGMQLIFMSKPCRRCFFHIHHKTLIYQNILEKKQDLQSILIRITGDVGSFEIFKTSPGFQFVKFNKESKQIQ